MTNERNTPDDPAIAPSNVVQLVVDSPDDEDSETTELEEDDAFDDELDDKEAMHRM